MLGKPFPKGPRRHVSTTTTKTKQGSGYHVEMVTVNGCFKGVGGGLENWGNECSGNNGIIREDMDSLFKLDPTFSGKY